MEKFDLGILGASGFTGQLLVEEVVKSWLENGKSFSWFVSGRSNSKLKNVLNQVLQRYHLDPNIIHIFQVDIESDDSICSITSRTRILLNCIGPYQLFGERVVRACLKTSTHQIDMSAEPNYLRYIHSKYNRLAEEKSVCIVSGCAYESMANDYGIHSMIENFGSNLASVDILLPPIRGNNGSWKTAINSLSIETFKNFGNFSLPFWSSILKTWCIAFQMKDRKIFSDKIEKQNINVYYYAKFDNLFVLVRAYVNLVLIYILVKFRFLKDFIERNKNIFSIGMEDEKIPNIMTICGRSGTERLGRTNYNMKYAHEKFIIMRVISKDGIYVSSAFCCLQMGLNLHFSHDNWEKTGVISPFALINESDFRQKLNHQFFIAGIELISTDE